MRPEDIERIKDLLPTELGSSEIRSRIAADILRRAVFSARMENVRYLARIRDVCAEVSAGTMNQATARNILGGILEGMGFSPQDGSSIRNPASLARLNLIIDTQTQMAASVARLESQTPSVVAMWPAWELTRLEGRGMPRGSLLTHRTERKKQWQHREHRSSAGPARSSTTALRSTTPTASPPK